jgi:hypothetical protein
MVCCASRGFAVRLAQLLGSPLADEFDLCVFGPAALFARPFGEGRMQDTMWSPISSVLSDSGLAGFGWLHSIG